MEVKAVTIHIATAVGGEDTIRASYSGLLRRQGNTLLLSYTEEDGGAKTSTLLTLDEGRITLTRRGAVEFSAVYELGLTHSSLYKTAGLSFPAITETESLTLLHGAAYPAAEWVYSLTLGGEKRRFTLSLRTEGRQAS